MGSWHCLMPFLRDRFSLTLSSSDDNDGDGDLTAVLRPPYLEYSAMASIAMSLSSREDG